MNVLVATNRLMRPRVLVNRTKKTLSTPLVVVVVGVVDVQMAVQQKAGYRGTSWEQDISNVVLNVRQRRDRKVLGQGSRMDVVGERPGHDFFSVAESSHAGPTTWNDGQINDQRRFISIWSFGPNGKYDLKVWILA